MLEVVEAFSPLLSVGIGSHSAVSRAARALATMIGLPTEPEVTANCRP